MRIAVVISEGESKVAIRGRTLLCFSHKMCLTFTELAGFNFLSAGVPASLQSNGWHVTDGNREPLRAQASLSRTDSYPEASGLPAAPPLPFPLAMKRQPETIVQCKLSPYDAAYAFTLSHGTTHSDKCCT